MKSSVSISMNPAPRGEGDLPANSSPCAPMAYPVGRYAPAKRSFTLVEMMVSMVLLVFLAYILLQITTLVATTNTRVSGGVNSFQDASIAFDTLTKTLSQATLNTYIDYYPSQLGSGTIIASGTSAGNITANPVPSIYIRQSELQFVCGQAATLVGSTASALNNPTHAVFFQAPLGYSTTYASPPIPDLLNACGFYIAFGNNNSWVPSFLPTTSSLYRYRLMEMLQPSENLEVYYDSALATKVVNPNDPSATNEYQSVYPPQYDTSPGPPPTPTAAYPAASTPSSPYNWIADATTASAGGIPSYVRPLADNIIALIIQPMLDPSDYTTYGGEGVIFPTKLDPNNTTTSFDYTYDTRRDTINLNAVAPQPQQQLEQNQLPPLMQVTMVAIDEPSAIRLAAKTVPPTASPNLIVNAGGGARSATKLFTQTANYAADMNTLTTYLTTNHIKYRVFTAQVPMFNAKWSTQ